MIIFREVSSDVNVIHIIAGPETNFQLDMAGHIVIPLDDKLDPHKKNILFFNRCIGTEDNLKEDFEFFSQKIMKEFSDINSIHQNMSHISKKEKVKQDPVSTHPIGFMNNLKCPKCLSWGTFVKDGVPTMCKTCDDIEKGRETVTPMTKKEKKILDSMLDDKEQNNGNK